MPANACTNYKNDATMFKTLLALILLLHTGLIYSQRPGDTFVSKCEYFSFVNDSIIEFITISSYSGALVDYKSGIGIYKLEKNDLCIQTKDSFNLARQIQYKKPGIDCGAIKVMDSGTINYKILSLTGDSIRLIGPIYMDYERLNRKRFICGFFNWPWRWSFRKQHWFDPRERILTKKIK